MKRSDFRKHEIRNTSHTKTHISLVGGLPYDPKSRPSADFFGALFGSLSETRKRFLKLFFRGALQEAVWSSPRTQKPSFSRLPGSENTCFRMGGVANLRKKPHSAQKRVGQRPGKHFGHFWVSFGGRFGSHFGGIVQIFALRFRRRFRRAFWDEKEPKPRPDAT